MNHNPSSVRGKKSGELLSTNHRVYAAKPTEMFTHRKPTVRAISDNTLHYDRECLIGTDQAIDRRKTASSTTIHYTLMKNGELWSTNKLVYAAYVYPPKISTVRAV